MEKASWPNTVFGKQLQQIRKAANFTQEELAFKVGLARTYISLLERGIKSPTLTVFFRLCVALDQKPEEVVAQVYKRMLREETEGKGQLLHSNTKDDLGTKPSKFPE